MSKNCFLILTKENLMKNFPFESNKDKGNVQKPERQGNQRSPNQERSKPGHYPLDDEDTSRKGR